MKRYLFLSIVLAFLLALWITSCTGGTSSTVPADEATTIPTESDGKPEATATPPTEPETESATTTPPPARQTQEPAKTATPEPEASDVALPVDAEHVVMLAQEDLAQRLDLSREAIHLVSVEPVDWPDASLGCPQPGMMYAQVITPGFRVVLEAEGRMYEYHSGGEQIVLCEETADGYPRPAPIIVDGHPWMPRDTDIEPTPPRR